MDSCHSQDSAVVSSTSRSAGARRSVLFVTRKAPPAIGGMETYSDRLPKELAKFVKIRTIVLPGRPDGSPPSTIRLLWFGVATAMRLLVARRAADVVHIGDLASWPFALAARLRASRSRVVISAHGTDVSYPRRGGIRGKLYSVYLKAAVRLLPRAMIIANSRATADAVQEVGFSRVAVVRLATDARAEGGVSGQHNGQILFVGRLIPVKGCAWFIREVLPLLPPSITLRVAGTVWNDTEAAALQNSRVTYFGSLRGEELIREYASALCVVLPNIEVESREFEGFGMVAPEAAAAGGVVLAADCGGLKDAVIDGSTGFLLPSGDAGSWNERIRQILEWSEGARVGFLRNAMETTRRTYAWDRVARETFEAYCLEG